MPLLSYSSRMNSVRVSQVAQEKTQEEMMAVMKMQRSQQQQRDSDEEEEENQVDDDFRQKINAGCVTIRA